VQWGNSVMTWSWPLAAMSLVFCCCCCDGCCGIAGKNADCWLVLLAAVCGCFGGYCRVERCNTVITFGGRLLPCLRYFAAAVESVARMRTAGLSSSLRFVAAFWRLLMTCGKV
jgi:hypothetical protein